MRVQTLMSVLTLTMEENLQGIRVVRSFAVARLRARQVRQGRQRGAAPGLQAHRAAHARHAHHHAHLLRLAWRWCSGTAATRSPPGTMTPGVHGGLHPLPDHPAGAGPAGHHDRDVGGAGHHLRRRGCSRSSTSSRRSPTSPARQPLAPTEGVLRVRARRLRLRRGQAGPARHQLRGAAGPDAGHRRAARVAASRPSPTWSRASTTSPAGASPSTASGHPRRDRWPRCANTSAWCSRRPSCSTPR